MMRHFRDTVSIKVSLEAILYKEKPKLYGSYCPALDLYSQGSTLKEAKENIIEATELFIESCIERGTLLEVLRGCGFYPAHQKKRSRKAKTAPALPAETLRRIRISAELPFMAHG